MRYSKNAIIRGVFSTENPDLSLKLNHAPRRGYSIFIYKGRCTTEPGAPVIGFQMADMFAADTRARVELDGLGVRYNKKKFEALELAHYLPQINEIVEGWGGKRIETITEEYTSLQRD